MAYKKTIWKARVGTNKNRFEKSQETTRSVILQNAPSAITEPGTPFSVDNMNKIEQGIADAHEMISDEIDARQQAIDNEASAHQQAITQAVDNEASARQQAITQAVDDEASARQQAITQAVDDEANVRQQAITQAVNEEASARQQAITQAVDDEADARHQAITQAVNEEANTRQKAIGQAIYIEAQARQQKDEILQSAQNQTNENLQTLQKAFDAWIGRGGFLDPFDFGKALDSNDPADQQLLTDYALSQITIISDPIQIWNGTRVKNLYNGHTWIITNTQDTDPPIFEWTDQGLLEIDFFGKNTGGIVNGADPDVHGFGYLQAQQGGRGNIIGLETIEAIQKLLIAPGKIGHYFFNSEADAAQWRLMRADGRTISKSDPRAERLIQYCLIPHSIAAANEKIMGLYLTNDYYVTKADLKASGKKRPTPAEEGLYLAIPCADGLFIRGAGENASLGPAETTLYDGNTAGSY